MEKDPTDEAQMLHNLAFNQLCAEYLDEKYVHLRCSRDLGLTTVDLDEVPWLLSAL